MIYQYVVTLIAFAICSATDIRGRKISKSVAYAYLALAFVGRLAAAVLSGEDAMMQLVPEMVLAVIPGAGCLLLSVLSHQALGYGDSIMILICGISLGFFACLSILMTAFLGAGALGLLQLCFCRSGRKKELPFFPFLLAGAALQAAMG